MPSVSACTTALMVSLALLAAHVNGHFDVMPQYQDGRIVTHGVTHGSTVNPFTGQSTAPTAFSYFAPAMRVFGYELGEDPLFPTSTENPGLNAQSGLYMTGSAGTIAVGGTGLPLGSQLHLRLLGDLSYWSGAGLVPVPDGERLALTYGSTRLVGTGTGTLPPLPLKTFTIDDHIHLHLDAELLGSGAADPTPGVFVLSARLESTAAEVLPSEPFWLVYNYGADEETHDAAIDWVTAQTVPEPSSAALLVATSLLAWVRRPKASLGRG